MSNSRIPNPALVVIGDVIGSHYYSHNRLNSLFYEKGAKGDPPVGSCVKKSIAWLKISNEDQSVDIYKLVGGILEEFMELDGIYLYDSLWKERKERVVKILTQYGLSYHQGGKLFGTNAGAATRSLDSILKERDYVSVELEFERALTSVHLDPPAALTAACAILESLFKLYIEDEGLEMPTKETVKPLWQVVQKSLGLDPADVKDEDLKRILSGMTSVVDGLGALRTHVGSAHGRGRNRYVIHVRHARLAIHSAHTLCMFLIETWEERVTQRLLKAAV